MSPILGARGGLSARAWGFTSSVSLKPTSVDYLVVAGGGGVYWDPVNLTPTWNGGGGAGGFRTATNFSIGASFTVTIGGGGARGTSPSKGVNSVFSSITATGGGGSAFENAAAGSAGGSGGGGGGSTGGAGGTGNQGGFSPAEGNNGGNGGSTFGGSGGGSSAAGGTGSSNGIAGGAGTSNSYSGSAVTYAAGGAGGNSVTGNGTENTGNGANATGNGGSGIVILRYPDTFLDITTIGGTLVHTKTTNGGYKIYRFTAGTGTVTV